MSVGYYDYAGRRAAGETDFTAIRLPSAREWYYDAASGPGGRWWIAGERGALYVSGDDGRTFADRSIDTDEDLFAIDFADADVGLAVGTHGAAFRTEDGGASWVDVSTGLDGFLGDVLMLDRSTAIAVGEAGAVLRFTAPP